MGWKLIPSTAQQDNMRNYLESLASANVQFPERDIAGLSDFEQQIQSVLPQLMETLQALPANLLTDIEPTETDLYKGVRSEAKILKNEAISDVKRQKNIGGGFHGSSSNRAVGDVSAKSNAAIMQFLGNLALQLQDRKDRNTMAAATLPIQGAGDIQQLAQIPRGISQAKDDAGYESRVNTMTFPYQFQAPIASGIIEEPRFYYKGKSKSGLGGILGGLGASYLGSEAGSAAATAGISKLIGML